MNKTYCVYMLASRRYGTLYIGVTSELAKRIWQHKEERVEGFTTRYGVDRLVWHEVHENVMSAITRENQIKKWNRAWKIDLIQKKNPYWHDLYDEII